MELRFDALEAEVKRAKPEDGEHVAREHDEHVGRNCQDCRNAINGENHVRHLDRHDCGNKGGEPPLFDLAGHEWFFPCIIALFGEDDLEPHDEQEHAENWQSPAPFGDHCSAAPKEQPTKHDGAEDAQIKQQALILGRDAE